MNRNLNIPNALSVLRILLIPVFLWKFLGAGSQADYTVAAGILAFSGLTDTVDGTIARRLNMVTQLGKVLDPIADKLTLAAVVAGIWISRPRLWWLCALFIAKEFLMMLGGLRLHKKRVTIEGAKWFGKLATVMFYVIMIVIVASPGLSERTILKMLLFLLLFMLFSLLQYALLFKRLIRDAHAGD